MYDVGRPAPRILLFRLQQELREKAVLLQAAAERRLVELRGAGPVCNGRAVDYLQQAHRRRRAVGLLALGFALELLA